MITSESALWSLAEPAYIRARQTDIPYGPWRSDIRSPQLEEEQMKALRTKDADRVRRHLAILTVCQRVYYEARYFPFKNHTFEFNSPRVFRFTETLKTWQQSAIEGLKLELRVSDDNEIFLGTGKLDMRQFRDAMVSFPRLSKLTIGFSTPRICILNIQDRRRKREELADAAKHLTKVVSNVLGPRVECEILREEWVDRVERFWRNEQVVVINGKWMLESW